MSFRLKTILLLTVLSLAPYVITLLIVGNAYRNDLESRLISDMENRLNVTLVLLDQSLHTLDNDLHFMGSLDVMNDILTSDLDRRIFNLLDQKKTDLDLVGDFHVLDLEGRVVASSDTALTGSNYEGERFISLPISSTFDDELIGEIVVQYESQNLTRLFTNSEVLQYSLVSTSNPASTLNKLQDALRVQGELQQRPEYLVRLEQDREFAFSIFNSLTVSFYYALAIGVLLIAAIAFVAANYIVKPILLLAVTARSVTDTQDYSKRVILKRTDEIGQLATAFNLMVSGMQNMIDRLQEESENRLKLSQEKQRTEMLQNLSSKLSKYLSPQIYESIFSGEKDVTLTSSRKKLTIFFADIVDFTATTDQMESEDLTQLLNQYLSEMTNIALEYGATLDKYIGDAIMIFFGDPHSLGVEEDAQTCVRMAIEMQNRVKELGEEWRSAGFIRPFNIRVGIHTGYCTVGNFGTDNRMDYTIIGSAVNLASRIESASKPGSIFISEDTYLLVQDKFPCKAEASIVPKGLKQEIELYEVQLVPDGEQSLLMDVEGFHLNVNTELIATSNKQKIKAMLDSLAEKLGSSDADSESGQE